MSMPTLYDTLTAPISPEDALRNYAEATLRIATPSREHTGHGRMPSYDASKHAIADYARGLAAQVLRYLATRVPTDKEIVALIERLEVLE